MQGFLQVIRGSFSKSINAGGTGWKVGDDEKVAARRRRDAGHHHHCDVLVPFFFSAIAHDNLANRHY